jgi:putative transposase
LILEDIAGDHPSGGDDVHSRPAVVAKHDHSEAVVTDKLRSYRAAMNEIKNDARQLTARHENNRAENSHLPFRRRGRAMVRFRQMRSLQKFVATHASVHNHFNHDRSLERRTRFKYLRNAALAEWSQLLAA